MKKLFALLLTIAMIFALCACDLGGGPSGSTPADGTPKNTEGSSQGGTQSGSQGGTPSGSLSKTQMETEILRRLSAISDLNTLNLCGGDSITYTEDGIFWAGDYWIVENPDMSYDAFMSSIKEQLTAAGFSENLTIMGTDYTVKAGTGSIGITVYYDSDSAELTLRMTNARDEYSKAFIDAENAKLPTIIESIDIIEKFPENFSITFNLRGDRYIICRYNGGYYVEKEGDSTQSADYHFVFYYAAVPQADGSYLYYDWTDTTKLWNNTFEKGTPEQGEHFMYSSDATVEEQINDLLDEVSIWGRMSWDYKELPVDEDRFFWGKACSEYSITENMTKVGAETFLGRSCEKVHSEGLWADTYDIIYDLETGMVMQMIVSEYGTAEPETILEVSEYNTNPTSLGTFTQP